MIFFFVIFNFLTIGGFTNLRYKSSDYNRTAEYVRKIKSKTEKGYFKYRHFFLSSNNFQCFIFSIADYRDYITEQIKLKTKEQNLLKLNICHLQFLKFRRINKNQNLNKDLYEKVDSEKRVYLTCKLFLVRIIKKCNQLSFSECINQKTKVACPLTKSGQYLDG